MHLKCLLALQNKVFVSLFFNLYFEFCFPGPDSDCWNRQVGT